MTIIIAIPVLVSAYLIQTVVISRLPLINGYGDLVMLVIISWGIHERVKTAWIWSLSAGLLIGYISAAPFGLYITVYLLITLAVKLLQKRIWQIPILAVLAAVVLGTFIQHLATFITLNFLGTPLSLDESLSYVTLPSLLINLILTIPVYVIIKDIADHLYPSELAV